MKIDHSGLRTWLEIDTKALKNNFSLFKKVVGPKIKLMAVVKSNAYGHGLIETSQYFEKLGADFLGVDSVVEARSLRQNSVQTPILVFGFSLPEMVDYALKNNISLTVSNFDFFKHLRVKKGSKKLKIHIKIETGLNRQGFLINNLPKLIKIVKENDKIEL
ncbi:MAG: alanine racemase, partial [bacterium]|nr:alanine racemase [bacterium]